MICGLLAVVLGAVGAQRCCTPEQWEGLQVSQTGFTRGRCEEKGFLDHPNGLNANTRCKRTGYLESETKVYYDAKNQRTAANATYRYEGKTRHYFMLQLSSDESDNSKLYVVDYQNGKCYKKDTKRPFREACVPEDARAVGEAVFGFGNNSMAFDSYLMGVRERKFNVMVSMSVTPGTCVPVAESVVGSAHGVDFMESIGFVNIKAGPAPEGTFDVPDACEDVMGEGAPKDLLDRSGMSFLAHDYSFFTI